MKKYVKETITYNRDKLVERVCDLCGRKAKNEDWGASTYDVNETEISITIKQKSGEAYPEGGSGSEWVVDLCPICFIDRLIPWLKSQGASIQEKEWSW